MNAVPKPPELFDAAYIIAQQYPVFPCNPIDKGPRTLHGFKDATTTVSQILEWWPDGADSLVGVPTGSASRIVVIDDDTAKKPDPASSAWLEANRALLESTLRNTTRSGGTHYVFKAPEGFTVKSRKGITVGGVKLASIDTRGDGGYIIWWPAHGYASMGDIQQLPQALIDQLCEPKAHLAPSVPMPPASVASADWVWNATAQELPAALAHVDPSDRDTWYQMGMAIHHEKSGPEGFDVWHRWSAGEFTGGDAPNGYEGEADCQATWDSFGKTPTEKPLTIKTLFARARARGYQPASPGAASIVPTGTQAPGAPPVRDAYATLTDRTDKGNANLLIKLADGNLRYVSETKQWLRWDGRRWQMDTHEVFVTTYAVEVARHYMAEARRLKETGGTGQDFVDSEDYSKWAAKCRNKQSIDNMIALARKSEGVPISIIMMDGNPSLLGVDNGVVDLKTGALRETEAREDFVTKRSPIRYNPTATAPRWESLIAEVTGQPIAAERDANGEVIPATVGRFTPRPALARYLQKALGYSITGLTEEQKFFLAIGEGSNGKGVVFDTVKAMLGPYAVVLPAEALMASKQDTDAERPTSLAATLAGTRLVVASESKEGQKLNTSMIKAHTGDREMQARRMRENPFTFTITHKLWLLTNVRPALEHIDPAAKGRLHFTPFDRRWNRPGEVDRNPALPDGDKGLMAHLLKAEAEGILAWLVRGAVMYATEGLTPPDEVTALTREYVMEQDPFGRWLATLQRCAPKQGTMAAELFRHFGAWCAVEGATMDPGNANAFGRALRSRGVESLEVRAGVQWGLRANLPLPPVA